MSGRIYPKEFDLIGVSIFGGFVVIVFVYAFYNLGLKKWWRRWRGGDPVFKGAVRWAAAAGDLKALDALSLSPDFDVDSSIEGFTALHAAVIGGHRDAVLWLCQRGANVAAMKTDGWGDTALHYAASRGDLGTARVLLAYGADPTAKSKFGTTPVEQARKRRHTELANYLSSFVNGKAQRPVPQDLEGWQPLEGKGSPKLASSNTSDDSKIDMESGSSMKTSIGASMKTTKEQKAAWRAAAARSHDCIGTEGTMVRNYTYWFRVLSAAMLVTSIAYLFWRGARSLVPYPVANYAFSIFIYVNELTFLPLTFVFVLSMWNTIDRPTRWAGDMIPYDKLPHVDVYVVRYSEEVDILEPAVIAALNMNWPGDKLTVHVLDDGSGKDVLKMVRRLRYQLTCMKREARLVYVARRRLRKVPHHSKAGNINHATLGSQGKGEYIMVLDTDMIVHPDFLQRTIGHFYKRGPGGQGWVQKPRTAFLQTPQDFWNVPPSDPMVHCARFFYGPMLQGRDGIGTAPCCGTGVVFSRTALVSIGGQSYGSITEDYNTSMTLFAAGFSSMFLNERLAYGMAPEDLVEVFQQRSRWAMGALQILFQDNPLCKSGLTISQSLMFFEAAAYHFLAIPTIIFCITPLLCLFLNWPPIAAWKLWEFAIGFGTFFLLNRLSTFVVARGIKGADNELWRGWQMWIWMAPNHIISITKVLIREIPGIRWLTRKKEIKFKVTSKVNSFSNASLAAAAAAAEQNNGSALLKTLGVTWYFLLYYVAFLGALAYAIVGFVSLYHNLWDFALDLSALGWASLNCICVWPPVSTLLPRVETAQGWRIHWEGLLSLGSSSSGSQQIGKVSTLAKLSPIGKTVASPRANRAQSTPFEPVESGKTRANSMYNPSLNGALYPYESGVLPWNQKSNESSPGRRSSIDRQRSANIGRIAGPLRAAASLQASALLTGVILPEREGYSTRASRQPSMLAVAPSGELGPAPSGALPVFSVQKAPTRDSITREIQHASQQAYQKEPAPSPSAIDRRGSTKVTWDLSLQQPGPSMQGSRLGPARSGPLSAFAFQTAASPEDLSRAVEPASPRARGMARASSALPRTTMDRQRSTNIGRVGILRNAASTQGSLIVAGPILPEREAYTSQASRQPPMLAASPSSPLAPAPSGTLPVFSLQKAPSSDTTSPFAQLESPWASQAQRSGSISNQDAFSRALARPQVPRSEKRQPAWLNDTIEEDPSIHGGRIEPSSPASMIVHQPGSPGHIDDVEAGIAPNLSAIEEEYSALYDSGGSTPVGSIGSRGHGGSPQASPKIEYGGAADLATLVALTGDPTTWAQVKSTGQTYNGADAGTLLEEMGAMADYYAQAGSASTSKPRHARTSMQSPFLDAPAGTPGVPTFEQTKPAQGDQRDASFNESTLRLDESLILDYSDESESQAVETVEKAYLPSRTMVPAATNSIMSSINPPVEKVTRLTTRGPPTFRPFAAAEQEDVAEVPFPLAPSFETLLAMDITFFKPFAAAAQDDCRPWMALDRSSAASSVSSPGKLSPGGRGRKTYRVSFEQSSQYSPRTLLKQSALLQGADSTFDISLILPESKTMESTFFSPFATAAMAQWDEPSPKSPFGTGYTSTGKPRWILETAPSAAQDRVHAVSHHLLDIAATMSPNASAALRSSSVLVVPVMPASVFEHSIGSKPCFEASPASPSSIAYLLVSALLLLALVGASIAEQYLLRE